jgi:hypothetical protein
MLRLEGHGLRPPPAQCAQREAAGHGSSWLRQRRVGTPTGCCRTRRRRFGRSHSGHRRTRLLPYSQLQVRTGRRAGGIGRCRNTWHLLDAELRVGDRTARVVSLAGLVQQQRAVQHDQQQTAQKQSEQPALHRRSSWERANAGRQGHSSSADGRRTPQGASKRRAGRAESGHRRRNLSRNAPWRDGVRLVAAMAGRVAPAAEVGLSRSSCRTGRRRGPARSRRILDLQNCGSYRRARQLLG